MVSDSASRTAKSGERQGRGSPGQRQDSGSLARGLAIIDLLVSALRPMSAGDIAEELGMNASSVHRLLQSLCELEYVYRDPAKRYTAGPKAFVPLELYHPFNVLRREIHPPMRDIRDRYGVTVGLDLFLGNERLILELVTANESITPFYSTHLRSPLHATASGKVMLLRMTEEERARALGPGPYERHTPHTLTDPEALARNLEEAERNGYVTSIEEHYTGLTLVGAPIGVPSMTPIGCIALEGRSARFEGELLEEIGVAARQTANLISMGSVGVRTVQCLLSP